jgi:hypothetical protein
MLEQINDESGSMDKTHDTISKRQELFVKLLFTILIFLSSSLGGIATGYYAYSYDISDVDPYIIWCWYLLLPSSAFVLSRWPAQLMDWTTISVLLAPILTLIGFGCGSFRTTAAS